MKDYINVRPKAAARNQTKKNNEETKNIKRRCSEETVQSWSPWSQSWGWKRVYGGKICGRGRSWAGSERERELWMVRVVSWQS